MLGAGDDRRTAELAAKLEHIYSERSDPRGAERFGELRRRFQRAAGLSDEELAQSVAPASQPVPAAEAEVEAMPEAEEPIAEITPESSITEFAIAQESIPIEEVNPAPAATSPAEEVHEVDLSDEWASMLEENQPGEAATARPDLHVEAEAVPEFELPVETVEPEVAPAGPAVEEFSISEERAPELAVVSAKTGLVVWSRNFNRDEPVSGKTMQDVVTSLDHNLQQVIADSASGIEAFLSGPR